MIRFSPLLSMRRSGAQAQFRRVCPGTGLICLEWGSLTLWSRISRRKAPRAVARYLQRVSYAMLPAPTDDLLNLSNSGSQKLRFECPQLRIQLLQFPLHGLGLSWLHPSPSSISGQSRLLACALPANTSKTTETTTIAIRVHPAPDPSHNREKHSVSLVAMLFSAMPLRLRIAVQRQSACPQKYP